ncbi:type VI secretion system Vgr family protein [Paraburkholderia bannensis]|uniref:type VI secretion system Vgr family protein n=1 Tax=Paraburkholderia bannensis TaxID=765414 RepID=UPI002AB12673|nr:type VI secretion system tip protein VgrG [Paraburkholderia bannensis]
MSNVQYLQAYQLIVAPQPAPFSVQEFDGSDGVGELYSYDIRFTSTTAGIPMDQVLGRPAKFVVTPVDPDMDNLRTMFGDNAAQFSKVPASYNVYGIITRFEELGTSADQTLYRAVLEPKMADLARGVTSRLFQKQSAEEIITDTLRHYSYRAGVDFEFNLRAKYKRHEYITQYHETTFAFIQRLCAEEGMWFRWEQRKDRAVLVFGDDLDAYARKQRVVPRRADSGLESSGAEAIKTLERRTQRVPESVQLKDYNHRQADVSLLVEQNAAPNDKTTNAVDYHWGEHYETPDEGKQIARLRHEAWLATQITYHGSGNPFWLEAGEVMRIDPEPVDAPYGIFVTSVKSSGGRAKDFWVRFEGIPADRVWRTSLSSVVQPRIEGILPARVTSPGNYKYAYLTEQGWYVVILPFDLDTWSPGGTSRPVRLAKPYSGDNYGHHFPLIDPVEVGLIFTAGDPNRPVIMGAMHDSSHPDLVNNLNNTRNLIRTAAQNELRMEDKEDIEHIHLTTPFQTSELNLGHMVDEGRKERGRGVELRSDERVAVRGNGVFITAKVQTAAGGKQLDMDDAVSQFESALQIAKSLRSSVDSVHGESADTESQNQTIAELKQLAKPGLLMSAPASIGMVSNSGVDVAARNNISAVAGKSFDISVVKKFTVAAGEIISFFAQKLGIKIYAGRGPVDIQAQSDLMSLLADKDLTVSSVNGKVKVQGKSEIVLESGGAFVRIADGNVTIGGPGDLILKVITMQKQGASSLNDATAALPKPGGLYDEQFTLRDEHTGAALAHTTYRIESPSGIVEGVTDELGRTSRIYSDKSEALKIFKGNDNG